MASTLPQDVISKLLQRVEVLETERVMSREQYMQEMNTLKQELADLKQTQPIKHVRSMIPRPAGEANRPGKRNGQSSRVGFNVKDEVRKIKPDFNWKKFTVFSIVLIAFGPIMTISQGHVHYVQTKHNVTNGTVKGWGGEKIASLCREVGTFLRRRFIAY